MKNRLTVFKFLLEILIHVFFWIGVYFFYTYFLGYGSKNTAYVNRFSLFLMPITITVSYFFLKYLIPKFLFKNKQNLFLIYTIYTLIVSFFFIIISIFFGIIFSDALKQNNYTPITKSVIFIVLGVYFIVFIVIAIGLLLHNYKQSIKNEDLKNKFLKTQLELKEQELKFLKMQIHPHFLFNTLNTLYGFALKKSDAAPQMILKLSSLLDYILYQVDKPLVFFKDEISHIENYISLEKMRFQEGLNINFTQDIQYKAYKIPPMLLLPFVENAFKHGVHINNVLEVKIDLKEHHGKLNFYVANSYKNTSALKKGIGLMNIKKRLKMLYQDNYQLKILFEKQLFKIYLQIPLKNEK